MDKKIITVSIELHSKQGPRLAFLIDNQLTVDMRAPVKTPLSIEATGRGTWVIYDDPESKTHLCHHRNSKTHKRFRIGLGNADGFPPFKGECEVVSAEPGRLEVRPLIGESDQEEDDEAWPNVTRLPITDDRKELEAQAAQIAAEIAVRINQLQGLQAKLGYPQNIIPSVATQVHGVFPLADS